MPCMHGEYAPDNYIKAVILRSPQVGKKHFAGAAELFEKLNKWLKKFYFISKVCLTLLLYSGAHPKIFKGGVSIFQKATTTQL